MDHNHEEAFFIGEAGYPHLKPALLRGAVAGIIDSEFSGAILHQALKSCYYGAFAARLCGADRNIVGSHIKGAAGVAILGRELFPRLVHVNNGAILV